MLDLAYYYDLDKDDIKKSLSNFLTTLYSFLFTRTLSRVILAEIHFHIKYHFIDNINVKKTLYQELLVISI